MFKPKTEYSCNKIDVDFFKFLEPFVELAKDIKRKTQPNHLIDIIDFKIINEDFDEKVAKNIKNKERLAREISRKKTNLLQKKQELIKYESEYDLLIDESGSVFSDFLTAVVFSSDNLKFLEKSKILFILKSERKFISCNIRDQISVISSFLAKSKLIDKFQNLLKGDDLKDATLNFKKFDKPEYYRNSDYLNIEILNQIYCPILKFDYIDHDKIKLEVCELEDIWVNISELRKIIGLNLTLSNPYIVKSKETNVTVGAVIDNYFLSIDSNIDTIIDRNKIIDFYWLMIQRDVYRQKNKKSNNLSPFIVDFNDSAVNEDFINTLSYLKKNLYLENREVKNEYKIYFDSVISLENLPYIDEYQFFLPALEESEKTLLGIYKNYKRPDEKFYNLMHWITNIDNNSYSHMHQASPNPTNKSILKALKPEISFYLMSKFFEDYFERILNDLGVEYASNYSLKLIDGTEYEIDYFVRIENSIYFIEAKTKLSSFYIEAYEKKCSEILNSLSEFGGNVNFLIVSAFSDKNCEQYKYYIDKSEPRLNSFRAELATKTYHFDIPIQSHSNKLITCISEPVYDKLKDIISKICHH